MDLTEAEDIKKRWQEYTELYKKDLHDLDNHDGVITHLEPDILECEVKFCLRKHHCEQSWWRWWNSSWAISNPERWCCESAALNMPANLENWAVVTGLEKVSFHSNAKECSNYCTVALISHASKVMLKILQATLQQNMNHELPSVRAVFRKEEEPESKLPTSTGSLKRQESSRKTSISALLTTPKPLTLWVTINCGKFFKR